MRKKLMPLALGMSLVAAAGCTKGHKLEPRKSLKGRSAKTQSREKVQDKDLNGVIMSNSQCIPLFKLVKHLSEKKGQYTMYIRSRSLTAGAAVEDRKLQRDLVLNVPLAETAYGSELTSKALFADFFNVSQDSDCSEVKFIRSDGNPPAIFDVELRIDESPAREKGKIVQKRNEGAPGRLTLKSKDRLVKIEYKTLDGSNDLAIDVWEPALGTACDGSTQAMQLYTRYIINLVGDDSNLSIGGGFAKLLVNLLVNVPDSLDKIVKTRIAAEEKQNEKAVTDKRAKGGMSNGGVKVDLGELTALSKEINAKHFQPISCSK